VENSFEPFTFFFGINRKRQGLNNEPIALRVENGLSFGNILELLINRPENPSLSFKDFF